MDTYTFMCHVLQVLPVVHADYDTDNVIVPGYKYQVTRYTPGIIQVLVY
jgi:hypothetical protein